MLVVGRIDRWSLPRVRIRVTGPGGTLEVSAIVDTGFTSALALPQEVIRQLRLPPRGFQSAETADGSRRLVRLYRADADWMASAVTVTAWEMHGNHALIGAELLRGHQLLVDYGSRRRVEIR